MRNLSLLSKIIISTFKIDGKPVLDESFFLTNADLGLLLQTFWWCKDHMVFCWSFNDNILLFLEFRRSLLVECAVAKVKLTYIIFTSFELECTFFDAQTDYHD